MSTPLLMPALSPTMTEGLIVKWNRQQGDSLRAGDVLLEIETDKAIAEVEAPFDGVLEQILLGAGPTAVAVGLPIALLRSADLASTQPRPASPPAPGPASASMPSDPILSRMRPEPSMRQPITPVARRLAHERGIDPATLAGSGPGGRIVKQDVTQALVARAQLQPLRTAGRADDAAQAALGSRLSVDCDLDRLMTWKQSMRDEGLTVTLNDLVVAACLRALRRVPQANAIWTDRGVVRQEEVAMAIHVSTPQGVQAPVLRAPQGMGLGELSRRLRTLADDARQARLTAAQLQGATFTVSNLGPWGIREFSTPVEPPQVCLLAVGAAEERPMLRHGAVAAGLVMTCTLLIDPRGITGPDAADFLAELRRLLENPMRMVL